MAVEHMLKRQMVNQISRSATLFKNSFEHSTDTGVQLTLNNKDKTTEKILKQLWGGKEDSEKVN